jgi:hypothetical protein
VAQQFSAQFPSRDAPLVDKDGKVTEAWYSFLALLASLTATPVVPVAVGASPFSYEASSIGFLSVAAGAVTSVVLQRGGETVSCPTSGLVPVAAGDSVTVTFTGAPTVNFIPAPRT